MVTPGQYIVKLQFPFFYIHLWYPTVSLLLCSGNEWIAEIPAFQILFGLAEEVASCSGDALDAWNFKGDPM